MLSLAFWLTVVGRDGLRLFSLYGGLLLHSERQKLGGIARKGTPGLVFYSGKTLGQSYYCTFTIVVVVGGDGRMGGTS